jgi:dihydrolipoamide dehydrogenase
MADSYDLIVLGSGPGGYVAAIRAAQLGLKTAIVERELLGGICLNWGCIPTKALLRSAEIYHYLQHAGAYGLKAAEISADLDAVVKRSRGVAKQLNQGVAHLMKKHKITVHMGEGKLTGPGKLEVKGDKGTETLTARNIIIATGARARDLPFAPADGKRIWTYRHALVPPEIPTKLLVIGSAFLEKQVKRQGMTIMTGAGVEELKATAKGVTARIKTKDGKVQQGDYSHAIVAIGIVPNTENIGLEALGVKTTKGHIDTDGMCRTDVPGLWAIGDVTAPPWLAHKAMHEAVIAAEAIAGGHPHAMDPKNIPGCTYCRPQIASVGLTEAKAKELGYDVKAGTFPFIGNGKAIALGEAEGFTKTVFDAKTGELLGAHMIGAEVTELIQGYTIGKTAELVEDDFIGTVFPHPTLSETMHEGVLAAFGRVLHI